MGRTRPALVFLALLGALGAASPVGAASAATPANKPSFAPDVSGTGRYVVFASDATNLVSGDTNGKRDVFLRDLQTRTTKLVSRGLGGAKANGASYFASVSDDGRFVAFMSEASNLVAGDTNASTDAFRADLATGTILRVSVGARNVQANGKSEGVRMSATGTSVVFGSAAANLVPRDTNAVNDIFVRDITTATTRRVSMTPQGNQNLDASTAGSISPNAAIVSWLGPVGLHKAVFRWDRATGRASVADDMGTWGHHGVLRTSNAGPSWSWTAYDSYYDYYGIDVTARPTNYQVGNTNDFSFDNFGLSRWGAMVVLNNMNLGAVEVRDATTPDVYEPPMASLDGAFWGSLAMSDDGNSVVGVDRGQIKLRSWRTGTVTAVSVT